MSTHLHNLIGLLREKKLTVSFAESCTGGKLSSILTEQPGISDLFLGSVVSYSNQSKEDLLDVRPQTLAASGAVSEATAREMARGVRKKFCSRWSVSITGIAGPSGGTPEKPVGTVCFAVAGPDFEDSITCRFDGERVSIQGQAAEFAMDYLARSLEKHLLEKKKQ